MSTKPPTAEQIANWTHSLVMLARASLPYDHPRCSVGPGRYPYETHRKAASAALRQMAKRAIAPPSEDELRVLAEDGIDIEVYRAERRLVREIDGMREVLAMTHVLKLAELTALADALRPAIEIAKAALAAKEKASP